MIIISNQTIFTLVNLEVITLVKNFYQPIYNATLQPP